MPGEEAQILAEARLFLDQLITRGVPIQNLLQTGEFPLGWAERYIEFVQIVSSYYGETAPLPREVAAVIYNASVYCTKRYSEWQRITGGVNEDTLAKVNEVRWAGD